MTIRGKGRFVILGRWKGGHVSTYFAPTRAEAMTIAGNWKAAGATVTMNGTRL